MTKIAIYAGSFHPWHAGHTDIYHKAQKIFTKVVVLKFQPEDFLNGVNDKYRPPVPFSYFSGLLVDAIKKYKPVAIIRGLRNGNDLQYEMNLQYWNEDLGLEIPVIYFIADRKLSHISSSAIREINSLK